MLGFDQAPALAVVGVEQVIDLGTGIAVVASNTWSAMQGAAAVTVDWGPADYPADTGAMLLRIEEAFTTEPDSRLRDDGDVEAELAKGEVIEAEYRIPFLAHASMEPWNATGRTSTALRPSGECPAGWKAGWQPRFGARRRPRRSRGMRLRG